MRSSRIGRNGTLSSRFICIEHERIRGWTPFTLLDILAISTMNEGIANTADNQTGAKDSVSPAVMFEEVLAKHSAMISRIILAYEADSSLRRDLHQEVMLAIWRSLPQLRRASSLKAFVAGIAYNQSLAHVARAVRRPKSAPLRDDLVSQDPLPDEMAAHKQRKARMLRAVQALPIAQKEAMVLCLEDFTFEEIGQTLGISARAAAMRCRRATAALTGTMDPS